MLFDIIVGNPPYTNGKTELSTLFFYYSIHLLFKDGYICFITNKSWYKTQRGKFLKDEINKIEIKNIIEYNLLPFSGYLVAPSIFLLKNHKSNVIITDNNNLINKLLSNFDRLKDINCIKIHRGITTGYNDAFVIDSITKQMLVENDISILKLIHPVLKKSKIRKYVILKETEYFINTQFDLDIEQLYPKLYEYLSKFKNKLANRCDKGKNWYNLRSCSYYEDFEKEKIIWELTANKWRFALDTESHYLVSNRYMLLSKEIPIKFFLGILNSKLMEYIFYNIGIFTSGGAFTLKEGTIGSLPFRIPTEKEIQHINDIVNVILFNTSIKKSFDISELEKQLNAIIYRLYNLTDEEINYIETTIKPMGC